RAVQQPAGEPGETLDGRVRRRVQETGAAHGSDSFRIPERGGKFPVEVQGRTPADCGMRVWGAPISPITRNAARAMPLATGSGPVYSWACRSSIRSDSAGPC